jgi:hypothetical protein
LGDRRRVFMGRTEGKRPLARPKRRWEKSIKWIFIKLYVEAWAGFIWLGIGTSGGHL